MVNLDPDFYGIVHRKAMRQVARMPSFPRLRVRNLTLPIVVREWMSQDFRVTRSGLWAIGKVDLFARRNIAAFGYRMDPASAEEEQEVEPDRFREGSGEWCPVLFKCMQ